MVRVATPSVTELDIILDYLLKKSRRLLKPFFKQHNLVVSGTKAELRDRLVEAIDEDVIRVSDVVSLLNDLDGWGDQHVFVFQSQPLFADSFKKPSVLEPMLRKSGNLGKLNKTIAIGLPVDRQIASIHATQDRLQIRWVERRTLFYRLPEIDEIRDDIEYRAYRNKVQRAISTFDWDLNTGIALMMIQELQTKARYDLELKKYQTELEPMFQFSSSFAPLSLAKAIHNIEAKEPVKRRQIGEETTKGGRASFTSKSRKDDVFQSDADLSASRKAIGAKSIPYLGNFYWQPDGTNLTREMHIKLYADENRVGLFGSSTEQEVRYLLSRVISHC